MPLHRKNLTVAILVILGLILDAVILAQGLPADISEEESPDYLIDEELKWLRAEAIIYSASKKKEKLFETPAAAYVLTSEDIRRSGHTTIPEVLRMVPGLNVARIDGNKWAVSARGFNERLANKLLVLVDGRSVYTPLFAGVFWEEQDLLLDNIERIEIIRGPGAALWGSNAVNGVINIISKNSKDTLGGFVEAGGGAELEQFVNFRYGDQMGEDITYRIFGKEFNQDNFHESGNFPTDDEWRSWSGGFRIDWNRSPNDSLMLQGRIYEETGRRAQNVIDPALGLDDVPIGTNVFINPFPLTKIETVDLTYRGGHLLGRLEHQFSDISNLRLQVYYERTDHDGATFEPPEVRDTIDFELQHSLMLNDIHDVVWGAGYRLGRHNTEASPAVTFDPQDETLDLFNVFLQDSIGIIPERLFLTLGSKFEHNDFTGFEIQPSARVLLLPNDRHTIWGSVARAVRSPARVDQDIDATIARFGGNDGTNRTLLQIRGSGGKDFDREELVAYELGYRVRVTEDLTLDITSFYNDYSELQNRNIINRVIPLNATDTLFDSVAVIVNDMSGESYGAEVNANWNPSEFWRLTASYAYLDIQLHNENPTISNAGSETQENESPHHQANLVSSLDLPWNLQFNVGIYYVDTIVVDNVLVADVRVPSYIRTDMSLAWRPIENLEVRIVGQNLFDSHHPESGTTLTNIIQTEIERTVFGSIKWHF